jgi:hypothetical protein
MGVSLSYKSFCHLTEPLRSYNLSSSHISAQEPGPGVSVKESTSVLIFIIHLFTPRVFRTSHRVCIAYF